PKIRVVPSFAIWPGSRLSSASHPGFSGLRLCLHSRERVLLVWSDSRSYVFIAPHKGQAAEAMSDHPVIDAPFEDDAYTMANLRPAFTGLPMVVWVSERGNAQHDVRVKVCCIHGDKIQYNNTV